MSIQKTTARVRVLTRLLPASLPPVETGLLLVMLLLAVAGSL